MARFELSPTDVVHTQLEGLVDTIIEFGTELDPTNEYENKAARRLNLLLSTHQPDDPAQYLNTPFLIGCTSILQYQLKQLTCTTTNVSIGLYFEESFLK